MDHEVFGGDFPCGYTVTRQMGDASSSTVSAGNSMISKQNTCWRFLGLVLLDGFSCLGLLRLPDWMFGTGCLQIVGSMHLLAAATQTDSPPSLILLHLGLLCWIFADRARRREHRPASPAKQLMF